MNRTPHTPGNLVFRQNVALVALVSLALFLTDMVFGVLGPVGGALLALVSMASWLVLAGFGLNTLKPEGQTWIRFLIQRVVRILSMYVVLPLVLLLVAGTLIEVSWLFAG